MKVIDQCPICKGDFMYDPTWDCRLIQEVEVNKFGETQPMYICQNCYDKIPQEPKNK